MGISSLHRRQIRYRRSRQNSASDVDHLQVYCSVVDVSVCLLFPKLDLRSPFVPVKEAMFRGLALTS